MNNHWSTGWPAPGKLNLMLRIIGQRPDGYHNLQTVFQFLDIHDTLAFRPRDNNAQIHLVNPIKGVAHDTDLTVRAACLLQKSTGTNDGVDIHLHKHLPIGAGMGGGSSDAATVLVALNQLWGCHLSVKSLAELGLQLGADVPVFVYGYAAWAEGVGEKLQSLVLPERTYLVLKPDCSVNTGEIFRDKELTRNASPIKICDFLAGEQSNDCLFTVCKRYPKVAQAIDWLGHYAKARLTGTGSCVFAEFSCQKNAQAVLEKLPADIEGFVVQGKNRSPLLERLKKQTHCDSVSC